MSSRDQGRMLFLQAYQAEVFELSHEWNVCTHIP